MFSHHEYRDYDAESVGNGKSINKNNFLNEEIQQYLNISSDTTTDSEDDIDNSDYTADELNN